MNVPAKLSACLSDLCCEGGCECPIAGITTPVRILNMNCVKNLTKKKGRVCDCGILWNTLPRIAVVELKGGVSGLNLSRLVSQLQGGLDLLDQQLADQPVEDFFPVLLYRGKRDPTAALTKRRVKFRTLARTVIARRCGTDLGKILGMARRGQGRRRRKRRGSRR